MSFISYPSTPHLEGSGIQRGDSREVVSFSSMRGAFAVVEEKIDGANSGFSFDGAGEPVLQSRGHTLTRDPHTFSERHFRDMKVWVEANRDILLERLEDRYVVFGEWMGALHSVYYDDLPHLFLEFDVWDRSREIFLSTAARRRLLRGLPIASVPVLYAGPFPARADLSALHGPSVFQTDDWETVLRRACAIVGDDVERRLPRLFRPSPRVSEGFYLKIEEGEETTGRVKWVDPRFVQTILGHNVHWQSQFVVPNMVGRPVVEFPPAIFNNPGDRPYDADRPLDWVQSRVSRSSTA